MVQKLDKRTADNPLIVDKDRFDALLRRMIEADPTERKDIEVETKKPDRIIPGTESKQL